MKIAYAFTLGALVLGSAAGVALQSPATAQSASAEPQNAPHLMPHIRAMTNGTPFSFADLAAQLQPAVVNISVKQRVPVAARGAAQSMQEFFRQFQEQQQNGGADDSDAGQPQTREAIALGSGFIIDPSGYVVTNNHVIAAEGGVKGKPKADAIETITVTLADRREYVAKVVGRDPLSDIALLKIEGRNLPYVQFGDSTKARVGDWALAIGNPFGLEGTVTAGIVSALHRNIGSGQYDRYIQTDASINQGNSGGPLFDIQGNVIGVNTIIVSPTGGNIGLGFSIPSEVAQPVIRQLMGGGQVKRGFLGIAIQPVRDDIADGLGLPHSHGEIVADVTAGGPGARAGLRRGDVILSVAGVEVTPDTTLSYTVANQKIGAPIRIEYIRDGKRSTTTATLGERPSEAALAALTGGSATEEDATPGVGTSPQQKAARASLGITLQALTPDARRELQLPATVSGVVIAGVGASSDAATKGLKRGDVILAINQAPTPTIEAAAAAVDSARKAGRKTVLILFQRGTGAPLFVGVDLMTTEAAK